MSTRESTTTPRSPYPVAFADTLLQVLADGEPHYELELHLAMAKVVPPELAIRQREIRNSGEAFKTRKSLQEQIRLGIIDKARQTLAHLRDTGRIERVKGDDATALPGKRGKVQWRCIDEDFLAWHKALAGMAERMTAEPKKVEEPPPDPAP